MLMGLASIFLAALAVWGRRVRRRRSRGRINCFIFVGVYCLRREHSAGEGYICLRGGEYRCFKMV